MTLPSRHLIRNSIPGGIRPNTLPLGHGGSPQYLIFTSEREADISPVKHEMLTQCCFNVGPALGRHLVFAGDAGPALNHYWFNVSCLLGLN